LETSNQYPDIRQLLFFFAHPAGLHELLRFLTLR
jgi:hypothetical protein